MRMRQKPCSKRVMAESFSNEEDEGGGGGRGGEGGRGREGGRKRKRVLFQLIRKL